MSHFQYILGEAWFWGRPFRVTADVLIPRPETEHIIEVVLRRYPKKSPLSIVDACTGSGCVAATLALEYPEASVSATDLSSAALSIALENAARLNADGVIFVQTDLLSCFAPSSIDLITANPPYVSIIDRKTLPREVLAEPELALFADDDGVGVIRRLVSQALTVLKPSGRLIFEFGYGQVAKIETIVHGHMQGEISEFCVIKDLSGIDRIGAIQHA
ncbi:MAG: peptide chain release factor N(5)-glutamine methyltransferase [Bacillus subtilis]|nr:peptide chain release factor N(5)-glutamine methyltransferase [Bacillus subtilis]